MAESMTLHRVSCVIALTAILLRAQTATPDQRSFSRELLRQLVEINTTDSTGNVTEAAEAMAARFKAAGFPEEDIRVLGAAPRKGNLVVRFHGTGGCRPVLFNSHLDVVEAKREDWSVDPFHFTEKDGWFYGRGTSDDKDGDAALVADFIRLKQEGFQPKRDLILALTADEETGGPYNGVDWLLKEHRDLIDAEYCINEDAGGGVLKDGKRLNYQVQAAEKTYLTFTFTTTNPGGHSSLPVKKNAIYELAEGLDRLRNFSFPIHLNDVTRSYFERLSHIESGQVSKDLAAVAEGHPAKDVVARVAANAYYNAMMHTTCVPTMLSGGHAENALPQRAVATVNCRLVPGDSEDYVQHTLQTVVAGPGVAIVAPSHALPSPFSPVNGPVVKAIEKVANEMWPGVPVLPVMETGATDGRAMRAAGIPTWGAMGVFEDPSDIRAHGRDERIRPEVFDDHVEFVYRLIKALGDECPDR
ncbi:MAG: M20/M25/M40 family metallo-hydrolase [Bryobacteraceae bacterium]|jgi:acetylornithine deacetylase/succinyl-diaminopimelate desuccinylase-like protein